MVSEIETNQGLSRVFNLRISSLFFLLHNILLSIYCLIKLFIQWHNDTNTVTPSLANTTKVFSFFFSRKNYCWNVRTELDNNLKKQKTALMNTLMKSKSEFVHYKHIFLSLMSLFLSSLKKKLNGLFDYLSCILICFCFYFSKKVPENERGDKFKWFACLTWVGRRPNPKFGATKDELFGCPHYK